MGQPSGTIKKKGKSRGQTTLRKNEKKNLGDSKGQKKRGQGGKKKEKKGNRKTGRELLGKTTGTRENPKIPQPLGLERALGNRRKNKRHKSQKKNQTGLQKGSITGEHWGGVALRKKNKREEKKKFKFVKDPKKHKDVGKGSVLGTKKRPTRGKRSYSTPVNREHEKTTRQAQRGGQVQKLKFCRIHDRHIEIWGPHRRGKKKGTVKAKARGKVRVVEKRQKVCPSSEQG